MPCCTPLAYAPGTRIVYSDLGFIVLADILEEHYQQPLDRFFLQRVAHPLGLHPMAYRPLGRNGALPSCPAAYAATEACAWRERVLVGEVHDENAWAMGGVAGHAGVFATAGEPLALYSRTAGNRRRPAPVATCRAAAGELAAPSWSA